MTSIEQSKQAALFEIGLLFSDVEADPKEQIDALKEIQERVEENPEVLNACVRSRAE